MKILVYDMQENHEKSRRGKMYEKLKLKVIFLSLEDVVRTSEELEWNDENVDNNGWT